MSRWNDAADVHFHINITTYLCYSPTCTPAQLSLLSEAIAKYSAFLEGKEKKTQPPVVIRMWNSTLAQWNGWKNAKTKHHSYGCMTGLCSFLFLWLTGGRFWFWFWLGMTGQDGQDDKHDRQTQGTEMLDKETQVKTHKHDGHFDHIKISR